MILYTCACARAHTHTHTHTHTCACTHSLVWALLLNGILLAWNPETRNQVTKVCNEPHLHIIILLSLKVFGWLYTVYYIISDVQLPSLSLSLSHTHTRRSRSQSVLDHMPTPLARVSVSGGTTSGWALIGGAYTSWTPRRGQKFTRCSFPGETGGQSR